MSDRVFGVIALIVAIAYGLQARTFQSDLQIGDPLTLPYLLAAIPGVMAADVFGPLLSRSSKMDPS